MKKLDIMPERLDQNVFFIFSPIDIIECINILFVPFITWLGALISNEVYL